MNVLINISEKIEEYIKDYVPIGAGDNVFCYPDEIVRIIQNGMPIPDNATVGEVFCMLACKEPICETASYYTIDKNLWNAPYQKGE